MNRQPESNRIEKKMNESIILLEDLIYVKPSLNGTFSMVITIYNVNFNYNIYYKSLIIKKNI